MEEKIVLILNEMSEYLSIAQMKKLQEVVLKTFSENAVLSGHCGTFIFKNESEGKEDYHGRDSYLFIRLSENKQVFKCDD